MPTSHDETLNALEAQFLGQFGKRFDSSAGILTGPPEVLDAALDLVVTAILRPRFPALTAEDIKKLRGQLTPNHRELLLACIHLLTAHKDIAAEAGFGPEVFQEILDMDGAVESLGGALDRLARSFVAAQSIQDQSQAALNAKALLAAEEVQAELDPVKDRVLFDQIGDSFGPARSRRAEQVAPPRPKAPDPALPPKTVSGLREQVNAAEKDAVVARNMKSIVDAAHLLQQQGRPLLPAKAAAPKHKPKGNTSP